MTKALPDDLFEQYVDEDISWRRTELQVLKTLVRDAARSPGSPASRATSRALAVLAYAHWEGYVKGSFDKLAEAIVRRRPTLLSAADEFVVAHLKHLLIRFSAGDPKAKEEMVNLARGRTGTRLTLRKEDLVRTHDNLRYTYFAEILQVFGASLEQFELSRTFVDATLCDRRNTVAHGRGSFPDADSVIQSADKVLEMLEAVKELQVGILQNRQYLLSA